MDPRSADRFASLRRYLDFTEADEAFLRGLAAELDPEAMIADFYRRLLSDADSRSVLKSEKQVEDLKRSLAAWGRRILGGPWDEAYADQSEAIGRRHVEVGLPQRFMPLAMNVVRGHFHAAAERAYRGTEELLGAIAAVDKVLDLELTLMLDTYHQAQLEASRGLERLRVVGQLAGGISHALKTPLGVIRTNLLILCQRLDGQDREQIVEPLRRIDRGARMASDFANRLLEFTRVKAPQRRSFPVRAVIDDALAKVGDFGDLDLRIEIEPFDAEGIGDPADLSRALADLIANAVAACREHGVNGGITVKARRTDTELVLEVSDTGPGVPPEDQRRIFEPLFTTRLHAAGLGLALCRELIVAHGGTVRLESAPGTGARFVVTLPQE